MKKILLISLLSFLLSACFWNKNEEEIPQLWAWQKVINFEIPTPNWVLVWDAQTVTNEINTQLAQAKKDLIKNQLSGNTTQQSEIKKNISFLEEKKQQIITQKWNQNTSSTSTGTTSEKKTPIKKQISKKADSIKTIDDIVKTLPAEEQKVVTWFTKNQQDTILKVTIAKASHDTTKQKEAIKELKDIITDKNTQLKAAIKTWDTALQSQIKNEIKVLKKLTTRTKSSRSNWAHITR